MATAILKRFPHLVKEPTSYADAVGLWHGRIKAHFKNNRFRNKKDIPEILERKHWNKNNKLSDEDEAGPSRKMPCWGVRNFLPEVPEGEDHFAIKIYQRKLKEQHNNSAYKQNGELIDRLMKKTFPHRR